MTRIRLVIASPGDVTPERDAVEKVCTELNRQLGRSNDFAIEVYRWETDSGPGFHVKGPQGKIDQDLPISDCDIMVAIFWTRFGSPTLLPGGETGTEHEINLAFESWKKNQKPQILIYFKNEAVDWDEIDADQIARVKNFQKEFRPGGRYEQGQYETFSKIDDFKDKLRQHLSRQLPLHGNAAPSSGFDFDGYRTRFGYAPKWDLSNIWVAQAPGDAPVSPTLEQIYQELRIAEKFDPGQLSLGAPLSVEDVAVLEDRILLIGAAGAGKTTWVRHVFYRLLQRNDVCPFLIELRKLAETLQGRKVTGKARSLVSYLEAALEELDCKAQGLEDALKDRAGPRPILLVDGWDELGSLGREFRQKLASFVRSYPRVGVIATSRPYGLEKPDVDDGFAQRYVQPLNDEEIEAFSNRFWAICYGTDPKHAESAQRFLAALKSAPSARAPARTPLLCTMMLFISRSRTLPDERHDLYQACIEHMLSAYRREEAHVPGMAHHWRPEKMNERLRAAAALAFAIHAEGRGDRNQTIVLSARKMANLLPGDCEEHGPGFLAWLAGPAGLLTDRSDGSLSFAHLSFQEYLAAWHVANVLPEDQQSFDKWCTVSRWQEVLRLWAAIMWSGRRERFAAVAEQFLGSSEGLCALGGMLADGWGNPELFRRWLERFLMLVETCPPRQVSECGRAWAGCRQTQRRDEFQDAWNRAVQAGRGSHERGRSSSAERQVWCCRARPVKLRRAIGESKVRGTVLWDGYGRSRLRHGRRSPGRLPSARRGHRLDGSWGCGSKLS
ncbi:MAG: NACHT domain-containing protein [Acidobacteriia bacterium]|nr:NACHT domain-containing protein [Terriglobia bacterium]